MTAEQERLQSFWSRSLRRETGKTVFLFVVNYDQLCVSVTPKRNYYNLDNTNCARRLHDDLFCCDLGGSERRRRMRRWVEAKREDAMRMSLCGEFGISLPSVE